MEFERENKNNPLELIYPLLQATGIRRNKNGNFIFSHEDLNVKTSNQEMLTIRI